VEIEQAAWERLHLDGAEHPHSFAESGYGRRTCRVVVDAKMSHAKVQAGITGLKVLKTADSEFKDFVSDRYRTLKDTSDRILATIVDATWHYSKDAGDFNAWFALIQHALLKCFASHKSLSVQQTLLAMGQAALDACPTADSIEIQMPNQHRIPFDLKPFGLENANEIFVPTAEPYGLIRGAVRRE